MNRMKEKYTEINERSVKECNKFGNIKGTSDSRRRESRETNSSGSLRRAALE